VNDVGLDAARVGEDVREHHGSCNSTSAGRREQSPIVGSDRRRLVAARPSSHTLAVCIGRPIAAVAVSPTDVSEEPRLIARVFLRRTFFVRISAEP
jgi:hypothetical protein